MCTHTLTCVVLIFLYPEFDHVFSLLEDFHGLLYPTILQTYIIYSQKPITRLQSPRPDQDKNVEMNTVNLGS